MFFLAILVVKIVRLHQPSCSSLFRQ